MPSSFSLHFVFLSYSAGALGKGRSWDPSHTPVAHHVKKWTSGSSKACRSACASLTSVTWSASPALFPLFGHVPGALPRVLALPAAPAVRKVLEGAVQSAAVRPKKGDKAGEAVEFWHALVRVNAASAEEAAKLAAPLLADGAPKLLGAILSEGKVCTVVGNKRLSR